MLESKKLKLIGSLVTIEGKITGSITNPLEYLSNKGARFNVENVTVHANDKIYFEQMLEIILDKEVPNFRLEGQKVQIKGVFSKNWGKDGISAVSKLDFTSHPTDLIVQDTNLFKVILKDKENIEKEMNQIMSKGHREPTIPFSFDDFFEEIYAFLLNEYKTNTSLSSIMFDLLEFLSLDIRQINFFDTFRSAFDELTNDDVAKISQLRGHGKLHPSDNADNKTNNISESLIAKLNEVDLDSLSLPLLNTLSNSISDLLTKAINTNDLYSFNNKKEKIISLLSELPNRKRDLLDDILTILEKEINHADN